MSFAGMKRQFQPAVVTAAIGAPHQVVGAPSTSPRGRPAASPYTSTDTTRAASLYFGANSVNTAPRPCASSASLGSVLASTSAVFRGTLRQNGVREIWKIAAIGLFYTAT